MKPQMPCCPKCRTNSQVTLGECSFRCPPCDTSFIPDQLRDLIEAKVVLDDCTRKELVDGTKGEVELHWYNREGDKVAVGYFGDGVYAGVDFFDGSMFCGSESSELRNCGSFRKG